MNTGKMFDTHMHTRFSTDSRMTIEEAVRQGKKLNLGIIVTEHMDLDYPEPQAFIFDIDEYFRTYERFRSETVRLGIELGMRCDLIEENRELLVGRPFDYVIGSIHLIDRIDIYQEHFYHGRTKREVYGQYFESMLACVKDYDFIDSLGHIDYIARYARFADTEVRYEEFPDYIDAVLRALAEQEKAIEINTRRLDDDAAAEALCAIYRRFHELGGRLVTIGSDAHRPQDIGKHFDRAMAIARSCRLQPVAFKARQPEYIAL
ncbi:MAG TPA: histidinol phosphate phosphatase [Selenomonadales bacterium]|nr:histidinol phosphate phosphatase [Selenomonadales bacterium]